MNRQEPKLSHVDGFGYVAGHPPYTSSQEGNIALAFEPNGVSGPSMRVPMTLEQGLGLIRALTEAIAHADQEGAALERAGQQRLALMIEAEGTPLTDEELQA